MSRPSLYPKEVPAKRFRYAIFISLIFLCTLIGFFVRKHFANHDLARAAQQGDLAAVIEALNHGADPNVELSAKEMSLPEMYRSLVSRSLGHVGPDLPEKRVQPLIMFLDRDLSVPAVLGTPSQGLEIVKALLDAGAHVDVSNGSGTSALTLACTHGDAAIVKLLLSHGALANRLDDSGCPPLVSAKSSCINLLLQSGAKINATCQPSKTTPLMWACQMQDINTVIILIKNGAAINVQDSAGYSALAFAVFRQNHQILSILLDQGADMNIHSGPLGKTPLMYAYERKDPLAVHILLEHGASRTETDKYGRCASDYSK